MRRLIEQSLCGDREPLNRQRSRAGTQPRGWLVRRRIGGGWPKRNAWLQLFDAKSNGDGNGYGDGNGNGYGKGYGYGDGYGDSNGYGNGYGYGYGRPPWLIIRPLETP